MKNTKRNYEDQLNTRDNAGNIILMNYIQTSQKLQTQSEN